MEAPKKRALQKHLQPARPLRRGHTDQGWGHLDADTQTIIQTEYRENNITVEQFFRILNLHEQKPGRITYSRDFLIRLASSPVAKKKPEYLPDHPIVLENARDPQVLILHDISWKETNEERVA